MAWYFSCPQELCTFSIHIGFIEYEKAFDNVNSIYRTNVGSSITFTVDCPPQISPVSISKLVV
jgi:hypothetical protein